MITTNYGFFYLNHRGLDESVRNLAVLRWQPSRGRYIQDNHVTKTDYAIWVAASSAKWTVIERNKLDNNSIGVIFEGGAWWAPARFVELNDNKVSKSWWADYLVN